MQGVEAVTLILFQLKPISFLFQDSKSLDPFLNQVKTIARKIKITSNSSQDSDEAARKATPNKYVSKKSFYELQM